jgi:uncharacterized protein (DUF433 family)
MANGQTSALGSQSVPMVDSWSLRIGDVTYPFAAPDHPGWDEFHRWLSEHLDPWSQSEFASGDREILEREAFEALAFGWPMRSGARHPILNDVFARRAFLDAGLRLGGAESPPGSIIDMEIGDLLSEFPCREGSGEDDDDDRPASHERISVDPLVMTGKPVVRGTRLTVEHILRELAARRNEAELLAEYPSLQAEDVRAALAYAADSMPRPLARAWARTGR